MIHVSFVELLIVKARGVGTVAIVSINPTFEFDSCIHYYYSGTQFSPYVSQEQFFLLKKIW